MDKGKGGFKKLINKVRINGPQTLYHGSLASASATFVGHYPWFLTYNYLNIKIPEYDNKLHNLLSFQL